jgi:CO/xanthine dehydrogenase FAD-binding subunit
VHGACEKVIGKAKVIASAMLEAPPEEIEFSAGKFSIRRNDAVVKTIQEIALATFAALDLPDGVEPSIDSDATFDPDNVSYPHGTHLCATEIDTETGRRAGPRHRPGAVRGGHLRRRGQPDHHHGGLPAADPAVRHRGTLGGSLAHADPAGDLPAVALALGATMIARGPGRDREIGAADFFVDYLTTALTPGEILTGVRVPKLGPAWGYRYEKFHRTAQAWATVGVTALARRSNGHVAEARIGLTNMGPVPVRARAAEEAVAGAEADRSALRAAAAHADEDTQPPADLHGAPDYRRHLARVLTARALAVAAGA